MKSDFLIVHAEADVDRARLLCELICSFGYRGKLFNNTKLEQECSTSRHILLCVSSSFNNEEFLSYKKIVTGKWLNHRSFRINPVHLDKNIFVKKEAASHMRGLWQFNNFYLYTKHFEGELRKEFEKYRRMLQN